MQTQSLSSQEPNLNWELATKLFNIAENLVLFHYLFLQSNHANPVSGEWSNTWLQKCSMIAFENSSAIKGIVLYKRGTLGWWMVLSLGWLLMVNGTTQSQTKFWTMKHIYGSVWITSWDASSVSDSYFIYFFLSGILFFKNLVDNDEELLIRLQATSTGKYKT